MFGLEVLAWARYQHVARLREASLQRDAAWIARNLGDVPQREVCVFDLAARMMEADPATYAPPTYAPRERGPICATEADIDTDAPRLAWDAILPAVRGRVRAIDGTLGTLVPAESLGREA